MDAKIDYEAARQRVDRRLRAVGFVLLHLALIIALYLWLPYNFITYTVYGRNTAGNTVAYRIDVTDGEANFFYFVVAMFLIHLGWRAVMGARAWMIERAIAQERASYRQRHVDVYDDLLDTAYGLDDDGELAIMDEDDPFEAKQKRHP